MKDHISTAIERIKTFKPFQGYFLAFSGGKDSVVVKHLLNLAEVKYDGWYNHTTIDPPQLVRYITQYHKDITVIKPRTPFLKRMLVRGFPTRRNRWCCAEYKECYGYGRMVVTGIRAEESTARSHRKMVEHCLKKGSNKKLFNPIIDWTSEQVWNFIRSEGLEYCELYDEGDTRLGCVFCPLKYWKKRMDDTIRYPKYTRAFEKAFVKLYENKITKDKVPVSIAKHRSGIDLFRWWLRFA
jgi:phosphoadenosine phosphosulfate reductase